jgi:hypothetical protein
MEQEKMIGPVVVEPYEGVDVPSDLAAPGYFTVYYYPAERRIYRVSDFNGRVRWFMERAAHLLYGPPAGAVRRIAPAATPADSDLAVPFVSVFWGQHSRSFEIHYHNLTREGAVDLLCRAIAEMKGESHADPQRSRQPR